MDEKPKKRGQKTLGGKSKKKKKASRPAKEISFSRMKSGHLKAKHRYDGDPNEEEHVVQDGGADDHLQEHLEQPQPQTEAVGQPAPSPGGIMGAM